MAYRLSALAEHDLDEIWSYVAEDSSPATADRLIDAIFNRFELLVGQPRMGRRRLSSVKAFDRSSLRAMSSTIGTTRNS
jgi:plasmid stabilization system protein ParE